MPTTSNHNLLQNNKAIWIISERHISDIDLSERVDGKVDGPLKEYRISDLARYLLDPNAIEVKKKLIGGEIHYKQGPLKKLKNSIGKILSFPLKCRKKKSALSPELIISSYKLRIPHLKDPELEAHLNRIYTQLKSHDTFPKRLALLDPRTIFQVVGICEDVGGNYSYLKLQGSIEEKIKYLGNSISKDVGVVVSKAYVAEGLYELRGYDFKSYDSAKSYRLFSYNSDGEQKACVLTDHNEVEFYIADYHSIIHMHLLEQSLKANPSLSKAFDLCIEGLANPVKLFFNRKLEIDYSKSPLPAIYREVFRTFNVGLNYKNLVKPILNYLQTGVSLNYVLATDHQDDRLFTHISVLHDFRALEPLRKNLPEVHAAVLKRGFESEAGRFYLLDSINGFNNA
ncbi:MAG: hypothetical protein JRF56_01585 [Deltaproteobacteria bacterium]|nr:hypothetical protein [Deltaproteobacteria bacterium]